MLLAPRSPMAAPPSPQQETAPSVSTPLPAPQQGAPPSTTPGRPVIVLDAAHGGTDTGARGETGIIEKDVVLQIARTVHAELERQGYRVVMSRDDDSNPSYDERAAIANAYRGAIFISLHVASTGNPGTVRAFYDQLAEPVAPPPVVAAANAKTAAPTAPGLPLWDQTTTLCRREPPPSGLHPSAAGAVFLGLTGHSDPCGGARAAFRGGSGSGY
jgi:N-acetylmuramoyl-L-alanine amidase